MDLTGYHFIDASRWGIHDAALLWGVSVYSYLTFVLVWTLVLRRIVWPTIVPVFAVSGWGRLERRRRLVISGASTILLGLLVNALTLVVIPAGH